MGLVLAVGGPGYRLPVTVVGRRDDKSLQPQTQNPAVALELTGYYYSPDWIQDGSLAVTGVGRDQYRLLRPSRGSGAVTTRGWGAGTSQWEARLTQPANQSGASEMRSEWSVKKGGGKPFYLIIKS